MANLRITLSGTTLVPDPSTKNYTISDADLQTLLTTIDKAWPTIDPNAPARSNQQLLLYWVQTWIDETITGTQRRHTTPPPPITIA